VTIVGETHDLVIIGAGEAGQAAAHLARRKGASVAIIDRELFGGSCPFWACMPSKALLHAAAIHATGGDYPWQRASDFRDWMIVRERPRDWPDDTGHVHDLEVAGATVIRGEARIEGPGRVSVRTADGVLLGARAILVAVGSNSAIPDDIDGLDQIQHWTNREATTARELPQSLVVLGAGPTGVEMSQVYARYGVPTILVSPHERINPKDHPGSSATLDAALRRDGVDIRTGVWAIRVRPRAGGDAAHVVELSDTTSLEGHEILLAIGRTPPLEGLGLETVGARLSEGRLEPDDQLRIADGIYVAGDPAGPEMHTHLAIYQGVMVARIALGEDVRPDQRAIPHATYTDPQRPASGSSWTRRSSAATTRSRRRPTTRPPRPATSPRRRVTSRSLSTAASACCWARSSPRQGQRTRSARPSSRSRRPRRSTCSPTRSIRSRRRCG
jgi:pyruvate/2-oxoglutarate dehydrogenase complex dihydrolipoamide dehydrogenase (E3) component